MIEVCKGLEYLHDLNILHRDLKIENIFVKIKEDGKPQLKIGDFGYAKQFDKDYKKIPVLLSQNPPGTISVNPFDKI